MRKEADLNSFYDFIDWIPDLSLLEITKIYIVWPIDIRKSEKKYKEITQIETFIQILTKINKAHLVDSMIEHEFLNQKAIFLPNIFEFINKPYFKDNSGRFILDIRITEVPVGFEVAKNRTSALKKSAYRKIKIPLDISLDSQNLLYSKDSLKNLQEIITTISFSNKDDWNDLVVNQLVTHINEHFPTLHKFSLIYDTIGVIDVTIFEKLRSLKVPEITIAEEVLEDKYTKIKIEHNFHIRKAKLWTIVDDIVFQVWFTDIKLKASHTSVIKVWEDKYVFIKDFDTFSGQLVVEESKNVEPFLKDLITNASKGSESPYPPGYLKEYSILWELDDIEQVTFTDALIINNITDKQLKEEIINERSDKTLKSMRKWDVLQHVKPDTRVTISIGMGLVLKHLDMFLDLIASDYSYLNIKAIQSFYFMNESRISSLDKFLSVNKYIQSVVLKVESEEILELLLLVLAKHPVLNISIEYSGDITEKAVQISKHFITECLDRTVQVYCVDNNQIIQKKFTDTEYTKEIEFNEAFILDFTKME